MKPTSWLRKKILLPIAAIAAFALTILVISNIFADAGNPILGTIRGEIVPDSSGTGVTVFVRGQWNWLSHGADCNETPAALGGFTQGNRAGTGVGVIWNDPNGGIAGVSERQTVTITGSPTGGSFKLKFSGQTTGTIAYNASGATVDAALEALSNIGVGDVSVTGGPGPGTPWTVDFTGALAKTDVAQIALASKSFTGGTSPNVTTATTIAGVTAEFNGYKYTASGITVFLGVKNAGFGNPVDGLVHPVDRGNRPENYDLGSEGDFPSSQAFVDPAPVASGSVTSTQVAAWKAGCGREPLSATASPKDGVNSESVGFACGYNPAAYPLGIPATCSGEPWGSWGYEKSTTIDSTTHFGYSHHFAKRSDVTTVCVNFYDVHGTLQVPSGTSSIDVLGNGDNSVGTNAFNPNQGANCIVFPVTSTTTGPTSGTAADATSHTSQAINTAFHDVAVVVGSPSTSGSPTGTVDFGLFKGRTDCTGTQVVRNPADAGVFPDNGEAGVPTAPSTSTYTSKTHTSTTLGTYTWLAHFNGDSVYKDPTTEPCGNETVDIVEAVIQLTPQTESEAAALSCNGVAGSLTNPAGQCHKIHAVVFATTNGTDVLAPAPNGTLVNFTFSSNTANAHFTDSAGTAAKGQTTDPDGTHTTCALAGGVLTPTPAAGSCDVYINAPQAGTADVHAAVSFTLTTPLVSGTLSAETGTSGGTCGGQTNDCNSSDDAPKTYKENPNPTTSLAIIDHMILPSDATGGSVEYRLFHATDCTGSYTVLGGGGTVTGTGVTQVIPPSDTVNVSAGDEVRFQAFYDGTNDSKYNSQASPCNEAASVGS